MRIFFFTVYYIIKYKYFEQEKQKINEIKIDFYLFIIFALVDEQKKNQNIYDKELICNSYHREQKIIEERNSNRKKKKISITVLVVIYMQIQI